MPETKEYCIDIEMTDGGQLITAGKANDMVVKYLVKTEVMKTQEHLAGLICFEHHNFPEVESSINDEDLIVIRVRCCCTNFLNIVDKRFNGK